MSAPRSQDCENGTPPSRSAARGRGAPGSNEGRGKRVERDGLMQTIVAELTRVGPGDCFEGTDDQYTWLYEHYGITEDDDLKWQCALADWMDEDPDLDRTDPADRELIAFLADERAMQSFLFRLRAQHHQGSAVCGADESPWRRPPCLLRTVRPCGPARP